MRPQRLAGSFAVPTLSSAIFGDGEATWLDAQLETTGGWSDSSS